MVRFFIGLLLGAGAILPGISSGVICVILGIYDKLIESITNLFKDFKKNFYYLLPYGIGSSIGVLFFSNILKFVIEKFPLQTNYCFIGLICGSIPCLIKKVNRVHSFRLKYLIFSLISFIIGLLLVIVEIKLNISIENNLINIPYLIFAGFLMSIGVVVPGVSNTLILMCLGVYPVYLNAISSFNLSILLPMGLGLVTGSVVFIYIIKFLFNHFYMQTYYSIIGFTIGSIFVLFSPLEFNVNSFIAPLLCFIGFKIAHKLEKISVPSGTDPFGT